MHKHKKERPGPQIPRELAHFPRMTDGVDLSCGELKDESAAVETLNGWLKTFMRDRKGAIRSSFFGQVLQKNKAWDKPGLDFVTVGEWARGDIESKTGFSRSSAETNAADFIFDFVRHAVDYSIAHETQSLSQVSGKETASPFPQSSGKQKKVASACRLQDVLDKRKSDCIGMAKLYRYVAGKFFGLDAGIVEVGETNLTSEELHACCVMKTTGNPSITLVDPVPHYNIRPSMRSKRHPHIRVRTLSEDGRLEDEMVSGVEFNRLNPAKTFGLSEEAVEALTIVQESFNMHYLGEDPNKNVEILDKAIELDPNCAHARSNRAVSKMLADRQDYDAMEEDLRIAAQLNPHNKRTLVNMVGVVLKRGDYDRAIALADRFLDPGNPVGIKEPEQQALTLVSRGSAHKAKGNLEQAKKDYALAAELGLPEERTGGGVFLG